MQKIVADLHMHSRFARACSPRLTIPEIARWAKIKGVQIIGTGDFTHPLWFKELTNNLEEAEKGLYILKTQTGIRFILQTEVSLIYSKNGKTRKIHYLVLASNLKFAGEINKELAKNGAKLGSDGRPIIGMTSEKLAEIVFNISPECMIIPSHAWTPWFGIFGSKGGFDSIEECFGKWSNNIHAIETGLSSDPKMNWTVKELDNIALISNSDAHSPEKIMREANVFELDKLSYKNIIEAIKNKKIAYTIEFFPEEGKYHWDGHRDCNVSMSPEKSNKIKGICFKCGRNFVIGVENRINKLASRVLGEKHKNSISFKHLIPLNEIIAQVIGVGYNAKSVWSAYHEIVSKIGTELKVLEDASFKELENITDKNIAKAIINVRQGKVEIIPGYDGIFGKIKVISNNKEKQKNLF